MRARESMWWLPIIALALTLAVGCGDDVTEPEDDGNGGGSMSAADSVATYWMRAMADSMRSMPEEPDEDDFRNIDYSVIRNGMQDALGHNAGSRVAHLGMAMLDIVEINYDPDLWEMIDSLITYTDEDDEPPLPSGTRRGSRGGIYLDRRSPIIGNQFTLLATAPRELARRSLLTIPDNLTFAHAQELIEDVVIPALDNAIGHMATVEADGGPVIQFELDDESYEIDQGEVLMFDASLHAVRAVFLMLTAYDVDLFGPDGTYGWVDDLRELDFCDDYGFVEVPTEPGGQLYRLVYVEHAREDSAIICSIFDKFRYNLEERSGFLTQRDNQLSDAYDELLIARDKLAAAVAAIRAETDSQVDDVIQVMDLVEIDHDIASDDEKPRFAENFTTIEDVLDWIETVLTGTYHVSEPGENGQDIEFDVNLSAFLQNAPDDWRDLLPYHRFTPQDGWITWQMDVWPGWAYPGWEYCYDTCEGEHICRYDIQEVEHWDYWFDFEPIELLDAPGGDPIDLDVEKVPYFPDYTFSGLFPSADRQTWLDVAVAAGW